MGVELVALGEAINSLLSKVRRSNVLSNPVWAEQRLSERAGDVRTQRRMELFRMGADKLVYKEVKAEDLAKYDPAVFRRLVDGVGGGSLHVTDKRVG